jgi:hypothetical protein
MSPDSLSVEVGDSPNRGCLSFGCLLPMRLVRPVTVVMLGVSHENRPKMQAIHNEHAVQEFSAPRADQSFADRVRARRLWRTLENPNVLRQKDCVEARLNLLVALKVLQMRGIQPAVSHP